MFLRELGDGDLIVLRVGIRRKLSVSISTPRERL